MCITHRTHNTHVLHMKYTYGIFPSIEKQPITVYKTWIT